jgi:hypothetical protein
MGIAPRKETKFLQRQSRIISGTKGAALETLNSLNFGLDKGSILHEK